jgi:hypothetical protein
VNGADNDRPLTLVELLDELSRLCRTLGDGSEQFRWLQKYAIRLQWAAHYVSVLGERRVLAAARSVLIQVGLVDPRRQLQ